MSEREQRVIPLGDPSEIPEDMSEKQEAEFRDTHEITEEFLEKMGPVPEGVLPPPTRARTKPISLGFDETFCRG